MSRFATAGLAIAIVVNLVLAALYLLSRDGQTTVLEFTARGNDFSVVIDGTQALPPNTGEADHVALTQAPSSGSIAVIVPFGLPSMPSVRGVDSVQVLDPSGRELFRDDFDVINPERWQINGGITVKDGVAVATDRSLQTILHLKGTGWTDYTLRVTYRNLVGGTAVVRLNDQGDGVYYNFELQRDFPNFINVIVGGESKETSFGGLIQTSKRESTAAMLSMALRSYPTLLLAIAGAALAGAALVYISPRLPELSWRVPSWRYRGLSIDPLLCVAAAVALVAFGVTYYLNSEFYGFIPHVPDEVGYMFQAKVMASGHFTGTIPPMKEAFFFYVPNFLYEVEDQWASFYPYGQPLVLAIGAAFGLMNFVPSLVGAGCVLLAFLVGRHLYGARVGLASAVLLAASPFFLMQASSFMSHNTAVFYMLLSLLFILKRERTLAYGAIAGLAFGLLLNTRPLTSFMLIPPFGLLLLSYGIEKPQRLDAGKYIAAFIAGALVAIVGYLIYNWGITGDPLTSAYAGNDDPSSLIGFRGGHTFAVGLRNEQAQLQSLLLVLNGWPAYVGLMLVLLPFALGTRNRWDYFCLACIVLPAAAHVLYRYSGIFDGPRYWYEAIPFLMFLTVRGAESLVQLMNRVALWLRLRLHREDPPVLWPGYAAVYLVLAVLLIKGSGAWLFGWDKGWTEYNHPLVPDRPAAMRSLFGVDNRLIELEKRQPLDNALVLVRPCGFFESLACYGSVFLKNGTGFNGDVIWARYITGRNQETVAAFPGRAVYVADWDGGPSIVPYDPEADR